MKRKPGPKAKAVERKAAPPKPKAPPAAAEQPKHAGGRPTDYRPEFVEQAAMLCKLGATDIEMADFFGVNVATLYRWKATKPEFCEALKVGKEAADDRVERSLFARANGYSHDSVKIFMPAGAKEAVLVPYREHVPPDTTAAIFWLKNRRRADWRDKHEVEHSGGLTLEQILTESQKLREPKE